MSWQSLQGCLYSRTTPRRAGGNRAFPPRPAAPPACCRGSRCQRPGALLGSSGCWCWCPCSAPGGESSAFPASPLGDRPWDLEASPINLASPRRGALGTWRLRDGAGPHSWGSLECRMRARSAAAQGACDAAGTAPRKRARRANTARRAQPERRHSRRLLSKQSAPGSPGVPPFPSPPTLLPAAAGAPQHPAAPAH